MPLAIGWFVWGGLLGVLYLIAFITAGVMTIRNGHLVMFVIGFIFPSSGSSGPSWTSLAISRLLVRGTLVTCRSGGTQSSVGSCGSFGSVDSAASSTSVVAESRITEQNFSV